MSMYKDDYKLALYIIGITLFMWVVAIVFIWWAI